MFGLDTDSDRSMDEGSGANGHPRRRAAPYSWTMTWIDSALDTTLAGYTKLGFSARGLDTEETFADLDGQAIVVTGATGGIGRATVERLAANGATVHAIGRNQEKLDRLERSVAGDVIGHEADLSLMTDIVSLTKRLRGLDLNGLVNNVGTMSSDRRETDEGFELTYATNLLGQYVLTTRLLPSLLAGAPSTVIMVSSGGMYSAPLTASNIQSTEGEYKPTAAYARTKRGQVALARWWADRHADDRVAFASMHPGWVDTEGVRDSLPVFRRVTGPFLRSAEQGADTIVWLVASDAARSNPGAFWHDRKPRPLHRLGSTDGDSIDPVEFVSQIDADAAPYLPDPETADHTEG